MILMNICIPRSLVGMSRSVTIAVAYVTSVTALNCREGLGAVRGARHVANPNQGFLRQLSDFEKNRLPEVGVSLSHLCPPLRFCNQVPTFACCIYTRV